MAPITAITAEGTTPKLLCVEILNIFCTAPNVFYIEILNILHSKNFNINSPSARERLSTVSSDSHGPL